VGAKTALLAFADGDLRTALRGAGGGDQHEAEALIGEVHPGYRMEPIGDGALSDDVYPPDDITYAAVLPGVRLLCDRRLVLDRPSELPPHLRKLGEGRRIIMHAMHSVVDWFAFAVWEDGQLVRSLSLSPDGGIEENLGKPYEFEVPYWAGKHSVEPVPGWPDQRPYPLPFHPLEFGEEALRGLFGFTIEGYPHPDDIDAEAVRLHGFRVTDPTGTEQAEREALYAEARRQMGSPRRFQMGPDGTLQEVGLDSP
jgi:hypothetical protein